MRIHDLLTRKGSDVKSISPNSSIHDAIKSMAKSRIGALMVVDASGQVSGIVTERDCLHAAAGDLHALDSRPVADVMTREIVVVSPEDDVNRVARIMRDRHCRHVPVMNAGRLCGILSMRDVMRERLDETRTELEHLRNYIAGA